MTARLHRDKSAEDGGAGVLKLMRRWKYAAGENGSHCYHETDDRSDHAI
jgi:hypothetical protein